MESCTLDKKEHNRWRVENRMSKIKYKVLVGSNKGGVGKSTVTTNLALSLVKLGYKVGLADADIHGPNIPKMLGIEEVRLRGVEDGIGPHITESGLKVASLGFLIENPDLPIIWRDAVKYDFIIELLGNISWGELDFFLVDLPPGTGNEQITIIDFMGKVDAAVVVTTPQEVAVMDARKMIHFAKESPVKHIGVVENMSSLVCPNCQCEIEVFKKGGGEKVAEEFGLSFLGRIPLDPHIMSGSDSGKPIVLTDPSSATAQAFMKVAENLVALNSGG
jgi:Mrp family chromosome partitioning ATPase